MTQKQANAAVTGAPGTVVIAGKTYLASPPADEDIVTFKSELQRRLDPVVAISDSLANYKPEKRASLLREAIALKTVGIDITDDVVRSMLTIPEVVGFFAWLLLRRCQPDLKLEEIQKAVTAENFAAVLADLSKATGMDDAGKADGPTG